jgi:hypothetical protein
MPKKVSANTVRSIKEQLEINSNIIPIKFQGIEISIKPYLPIGEKLILIQNVVSGSFAEDMFTGVKKYNPTIKEILLVTFITKSYANLNETENESEMFDILMSTGLFKEIVATIPKEEINWIYTQIEARIEEEKENNKNDMSVGVVLKAFLEKTDGNFLSGLDSLKNFDGDKLNSLVRLADVASNVT